MILGDFGLNCMGNESEIVSVIAEVIVGVFFSVDGWKNNGNGIWEMV
jgi:hypothetical protein